MSRAIANSSEFQALVFTPDPPRLGPQRRPGTAGESEIAGQLATFFAAQNIAAQLQPLLRSAALLWHDHLDASHTIAQDIETREGSWLHGIMHRREPDYGNAKYWFKRVGRHAAFATLATRAAELVRGRGDSLLPGGEWDPFAFIDECEAAEQGNDAEAVSMLRQIQAAEFEVLVEHIFAANS